MTLLPILQKIADQSRVGSAYLLCGMHAQELKTQALLFAKRLNCLKGTLCESCISCKKIDRTTHPDVTLIESQGETIKIETLRELQRVLHLKPYEGQWKVVIIDGAEQLNPASGNSMLKILEEPPIQTVFLLLTPHMERLLPTIISRCHIIRISHAVSPALAELEWATELLSLPREPEHIFELAKKVSQDDTTFDQSLETLTVWYHDLLCFKQGLRPQNSPLQKKEILAQNISSNLSFQAITDKLTLVLEAKKNLQFQLNRELLAEALLFQLAR
ncbi:MAG: hypothetical protein HYY62_05635 [Deltaproteobacteria bacterium]|nr:hypothetical protein [Deltaproteobacteria bacterium]